MMIKTLLIGNGLYGLAMLGLWTSVGQDRARFLPAFLFATLTFFAGILTGVIASQPKRRKKKPLPGRTVAVTSDAFESLTE